MSAIIRNTLRTSVRARQTIVVRSYATTPEGKQAEKSLGEKVKKAAQAFKVCPYSTSSLLTAILPSVVELARGRGSVG
jgi:hypothetical protein